MIYNKDFMVGIIEQDIKDVSLIVTSPPYLDARNYGGEALFKDPDDWGGWCFYSILNLSNTLKEGGVIWWNTGSGYRDGKKLVQVYDMIAQLYYAGVYLIDEIPWTKTSSPPKKLKNRPYPAWEHNYILSREPDKVEYNRDSVRRPYAKSTLSRMKYKLGNLSADLEGEYGEEDKRVKPNPKGATHPNYLNLPQDTSRRPHPAPMLPLLANWAIRAYSKTDELVLDPMAGIGTTWIESIKLHRKFIGFELFPEYIEIAKLSKERLDRGDDPYNGLKDEWESINV